MENLANWPDLFLSYSFKNVDIIFYAVFKIQLIPIFLNDTSLISLSHEGYYFSRRLGKHSYRFRFARYKGCCIYFLEGTAL